MIRPGSRERKRREWESAELSSLKHKINQHLLKLEIIRDDSSKNKSDNFISQLQTKDLRI